MPGKLVSFGEFTSGALTRRSSGRGCAVPSRSLTSLIVHKVERGRRRAPAAQLGR